MTNHDRFEELIPIYALGALDGEELKEIEEHLRTGCGVCEELLREQERIVSLIPYSVTTLPPSSRVKGRLFEKIKATKKVGEKPYAPSFWERLQPVWLRLGGAVALALLAILFVFNLYQRTEIGALKEQIVRQSADMKSLGNKLAKKEVEVNNLKEEITRQGAVVKFLQDPNVVVINLVNLQPTLKARGRVLWNTESNQAVFYGLNLPQAPSGKTYQLWVIADNTPKSAGIFHVDDKGNNVMKLESLPDPSKIQKFAVTLEPEGGVPLPTGEMYLIGES